MYLGCNNLLTLDFLGFGSMVIGSSRYFTCHPYLENIGNCTILLGNWKDLLAAVSS